MKTLKFIAVSILSAFLFPLLLLSCADRQELSLHGEYSLSLDEVENSEEKMEEEIGAMLTANPLLIMAVAGQKDSTSGLDMLKHLRIRIEDQSISLGEEGEPFSDTKTYTERKDGTGKTEFLLSTGDTLQFYRKNDQTFMKMCGLVYALKAKTNQPSE